MPAIFFTTSDALYFSYVIQQYPITANSSMRPVIAAIRQKMGKPEMLRAKTTTGLHDMHPTRLHGMHPIDVRHQCANIRATVRDRLPLLHAQAIEAKYSEDRDVKRLAIRALAEHFACEVNIPVDCTLALTWRHYMPDKRRNRDFTCRQIGIAYGISKSRVHLVSRRLAQGIETLQADAIDRLSRGMERAGIVEPI